MAAPRPLMVIDDDPEQRAMLQDLLIRRAFDVTTAADGEEGLRLSRVRRRGGARSGHGGDVLAASGAGRLFDKPVNMPVNMKELAIAVDELLDLPRVALA